MGLPVIGLIKIFDFGGLSARFFLLFLLKPITPEFQGSAAFRDRAHDVIRCAHQRGNVLGCPWRMDFSRALALLMASRGNATSMSFFLLFMIFPYGS